MGRNAVLKYGKIYNAKYFQSHECDKPIIVVVTSNFINVPAQTNTFLNLWENECHI